MSSVNMPGVRNHILLLGAGLVCLLALLAGAAAVSLNEFVTPCKSKDPALNDCVRQAAQDLFHKAAKGIPALGIPILDPAKVAKLELARQGSLSMSLIFNNSVHYGLSETRVKSASVDPGHNVYNFTIFIPKYVVAGDYDVNGRVILLPITGHGQANITLHDIESVWSFTGEQEQRDGEKFLKLTNLVTHIHHDSPKKVELHFDGLFGGNKILGDTMNDFMNSNWQELTKQLKPSVQASFDRRMLPLAQRFVAKFPLSELFPDL